MEQRSRGVRRTEMTARDKQTGREVKGTTTVEQVGKRGTYNALVKVTNGITLTYGYQSVRLDVGIELPFEYADTEDITNAYAEAYRIVDEELAERSREMDSLLRDLAGKYQR